jgi:N utilization substance protein A
MASLLYQTIEQISREKHIEPEVIVAAIEDAMIVAARKFYKTEEDLRAKFNPDSGQIDVFAVRPVVEEITDAKKEFTLAEAKRFDPNVEVGGEIVIPKPTAVLGRIAAQTAKQVIMQKVREAERDTIFNEYNGRVGELVNCVVKRTEGPDVIVDLGRAEAQTRAIAPGNLQYRRPLARRHSRCGQILKRASGHRFSRRSHSGATPF